jgi:hypothetical protein
VYCCIAVNSHLAFLVGANCLPVVHSVNGTEQRASLHQVHLAAALVALREHGRPHWHRPWLQRRHQHRDVTAGQAREKWHRTNSRRHAALGDILELTRVYDLHNLASEISAAAAAAVV